MQTKSKFLKATVIGGIFFLIPIAIVLVVVGKLVDILKAVAEVLLPIFPADTSLGVIGLEKIKEKVLRSVSFDRIDGQIDDLTSQS